MELGGRDKNVVLEYSSTRTPRVHTCTYTCTVYHWCIPVATYLLGYVLEYVLEYDTCTVHVYSSRYFDVGLRNFGYDSQDTKHMKNVEYTKKLHNSKQKSTNMFSKYYGKTNLLQ